MYRVNRSIILRNNSNFEHTKFCNFFSISQTFYLILVSLMKLNKLTYLGADIAKLEKEMLKLSSFHQVFPATQHVAVFRMIFKSWRDIFLSHMYVCMYTDVKKATISILIRKFQQCWCNICATRTYFYLGSLLVNLRKSTGRGVYNIFLS